MTKSTLQILNGCWNFDISEAPKGRMVTRHGVGNAKADIQVFEPEKIWVASDCGKVGTSYFIPEQDRWCGFTKGQTPKAWMPIPSHPDTISTEEQRASA